MDFNKAFDSIKRRALTFKVVTSDIEGINVVDSIKYLGVTINNTRKCFTRQKRIMIEEAQKMAISSYSIIHNKKKRKSCKSVALPSISVGVAVLSITEKAQTHE